MPHSLDKSALKELGGEMLSYFVYVILILLQLPVSQEPRTKLREKGEKNAEDNMITVSLFNYLTYSSQSKFFIKIYLLHEI